MSEEWKCLRIRTRNNRSLLIGVKEDVIRIRSVGIIPIEAKLEPCQQEKPVQEVILEDDLTPVRPEAQYPDKKKSRSFVNRLPRLKSLRFWY